MTRRSKTPVGALHQIGRDWEALAAADPLWAILTDPGTRGGKWDVDAFFESGRREVRLLLDELETHGLLPFARERLRTECHALDFGCGVGRLTQGLCDHFGRAIGVDISPTMIRLADEHNAHADRCRYVHNDAADLAVLGDARFDLCYSFIVLQHMPWDAAQRYLADMAAQLTPTGLLVFQLPSEARISPPRTVFHAAARRGLPRWARRWVHRAIGDPLAMRMQMHATPRGEVEAFLGSLGLTVKHARVSDAAGAGFSGFLYAAGRA
ncbi:MAG: class I SAM-dependent methyltransferase [Planctomycetota bacterium]